MAQLTSFLISSIFISTVLAFKDGVNTRITHNSTEILSRKKRFFALRTEGWRLRAIFGVVMPLEDGNGGPLSIEIPVTYDIDSGDFSGRSFVPSYAPSDRAFKSGEDHRTATLKRIENYLTRMGGVVKDGHACILRAICEVAETPENSDGFLGDLISTILVPSYALDGVNGTVFNETDYTRAQKDGFLGEGCTHYQENCTVSLFEYVEGNDATNTTGYYTSQYIGSSLDPFTNDYPEYLDGLFNIDGSQDPIYGF